MVTKSHQALLTASFIRCCEGPSSNAEHWFSPCSSNSTRIPKILLPNSSTWRTISPLFRTRYVCLLYYLIIVRNLTWYAILNLQVIDEPLFLMHHIDIMVSVTGSNLLQGFRESLLPNPLHTTPEEDEDDEDIASIMQRLPSDTRPFEDFLTAAQGCLLLLMLKQHLKEQYGLTDAKVSQYSPSEGAKIYDKNAPRKVITIFMPRPTLQALKGTSHFFQIFLISIFTSTHLNF